MGLPGDNITTSAHMQQAFNNKYEIIVGPKTPKKKSLDRPWDMMNPWNIMSKGSNSTKKGSNAPSIPNHSSYSFL